MRISLLGSVTVSSGRGSLEERHLPGRQGRVVLAHLAADRHRPVPRDELADALWLHRLPPSWDKALAAVVSRLRAALGSVGLDGSKLITNAFGCYQLRLPPGSRVDVEEAASACELAEAKLRDGDPKGAGEAAGVAASLARQLFLPGDEGSWVDAKRAELREVHLRALGCLAEAGLAAGDPAAAAAAAEESVALEPYTETGYQRLMRAHAAGGDRAQALRVYARCRELLRDELGVDPSPETERVYLRILRSGVGERPAEVPPNLPVQANRFVGRALELAELSDLLGRRRLVSLVGAGGSGKTRLAVETAARVLERFPHGAWFVDLAPLTEPDQVPRALARILGLREEPGRDIGDMVAERIGGREMLVVLDNCERLISPVAGLAAGLLRSCPRLRLLTTTRRRLGTDEETVFLVRALETPAAEGVEGLARFESVELFVDRAVAANPRFRATDQNLPTIATVCRRLDGLPLAIELAAARARVLGVEEIDERLHDRFELPATTAAPPRHRSLWASLEWTYDLLGEDEALLFRRLAVFTGGFGLGTAESVCAGGPVGAQDVLGLLTALVDHSLVLVDEEEGRARYRLLETVREYALGRLEQAGEAEAVRTGLLDWSVSLAEAAAAELRGPHQAVWLRRLESEHENFRASLEWAGRAGREEALLRLAASLGRFWRLRGHFSEGRRWLDAALREADGASRDALVKALLEAGSLAAAQGDYTSARAMLDDGLAVAREERDERQEARALIALGDVAFQSVNYTGARALFEKALAIARHMDDVQEVAAALAGLGNVAQSMGEHDKARSLHVEALVIERSIGDRIRIAGLLKNLANTEFLEGNLPVARSLHEEGLAISRELGDTHAVASSLYNMSLVAHAQGDFDGARSLNEESLTIRSELGDRRGIAMSLYNLGRIAGAVGDFALARLRQEESLAIARRLGEKRIVERCLIGLGLSVRALGDRERSRALLEEGLVLAREIGDRHGEGYLLNTLGACARDAGDLDRSAALHAEALSLFGELRHQQGIAEALEASAALAGDWGEGRRAARLFGAAETLRETINVPIEPSVREGYEASVKEACEGLDPGDLRAAWDEGRAMPPERALEETLRAIDAS